MTTTESATPKDLPEPYADYDEDYYDVAQYISDDEDELQDWDFWKAQDAVDRAKELNEIYKTNVYRAVKVRRRVEFRPVRDTDR